MPYVVLHGVEFKYNPDAPTILPTLKRFVDASLAKRLEAESKSDAADTPILGDIQRQVSAAVGMPILISVVF